MAHGQLFRSDGSLAALGAVLGRGGEGEVRDVVTRPDLVAKIYNQRPTGERVDKLVAMVRVAAPDLAGVAAWPVDTLHDRPGGAVVGFLMPKVGDRTELHKLTHPMDRLRNYPDVGYDFLVHVATNLARAFAVVHARGLVIGDVNESGVMVGKDGTLMLIDTDSMQLEHSGRRYLCDVGKPEFQPPEILNKHASFRGLHRTTEHDAFGLAVLVFQLLFFGWHPFNVRMLIGDQEPIADNIKEARYPYAQTFRQRDYARPPHALDPANLPEFLRDLFDRAFLPGRGRPTASEWLDGLTRFSAEAKSCARFATHAYHASLPRCPLCELDQRLGFPILPHIAMDGVKLRQIWRLVQSAYFELSAPIPEPPAEDPSDLMPIEVDPAIVAHARRRVTWTYWQIFLSLSAMALAVLVHPATLTLLAAPLALELQQRRLRPAAQRAIEADHARDVAALEAARAVLRAGPDAAVIQNFEEARQTYERVIHFDDHRMHVIAALHDRAFPEQMRRFLGGVRLTTGVVPGFGPKRIQALAARGIRTALDVERGLPKDLGLDEAHLEVLLRWREFHKSQFMPDLADPKLLGRVSQENERLDTEYARLVERMKLSAEWLTERVPRERERRRQALARYEDLVLKLACEAPRWRLVRARLRLPRAR